MDAEETQQVRNEGAHGGTAMERLLVEAEELAQLGSWGMDLRTLEAVWSDGYYRIHGLVPGEIAPGIEMLLERTHPQDRDRLRELLESIVASPEDIPTEGVTAEYRAILNDGSVREVRFLGRVSRDPEGRATRWYGVGQDVTDQRLTERELQAHYAISQAIRDWESFEEGVVGLLRRVGTALDYPMGSMWAWDEERERLVARAFWIAPPFRAEEFEPIARERALRPGEGLPGRVWERRRAEAATDVDVGTGPDAALAARVGLRTALAFPALGDAGPLAVLSFHHAERREPTERLLTTLESMGGELGRFLEQRRGQLGTQRLSDRELEVLQLAAEGNSGPQIAERLFVSPTTIKTHFEHIYEKLGVGDRAAAVAYALRTGIIR